MWIIIAEVNDYNQHGSYFVGTYINKPSVNELAKLLNQSAGDKVIQNLVTGGGRINLKHEWYFLKEVVESKNYYYEYFTTKRTKEQYCIHCGIWRNKSNE